MEFGSRFDIDDEIGEKIRNDVVNEPLGKLRDLVQKKWISSHSDINIWTGSNLPGLGTYYSNIEVQTADWLCQNLFNIGKFLDAEMKISAQS